MKVYPGLLSPKNYERYRYDIMIYRSFSHCEAGFFWGRPQTMACLNCL